MMLDHDVVAVSPASVWRVLRQAGLLSRWKGKPSRKGTGFEQPLEPHQHWHVDVSYINLSGTFSYLCSVLDGCSRFLVHWDLRESMKEADIERILERAKKKYPDARPQKSMTLDSSLALRVQTLICRDRALRYRSWVGRLYGLRERVCRI